MELREVKEYRHVHEWSLFDAASAVIYRGCQYMVYKGDRIAVGQITSAARSAEYI
jgi:hypothetical protein